MIYANMKPTCKCHRETEWIYTIDNIETYYCDNCDQEINKYTGYELYGPDEQLRDEAGR